MRRGFLAPALLLSACEMSTPRAPLANSVAESSSPTPATQDRVFVAKGRNDTMTLPDGQSQIVASMLNSRGTMRFGDYIWNDKGVRPGAVWVRVDLTRQTLSVFRAGHEIGATVILYGATAKPTPAGVFPIQAKKVEHRSSLYDAEMPYMLRLTGDGVAIHASQVRKGFATHGCIGVPRAFAKLLYDEVKVGDRVAIFDS